MTPVVLLAVFCTLMAVVAVGKLALADERPPIDVGTTLLVLGITAFVFVWLDLEVEWSPTGLGPLLIAVGVVAITAGVALIVDDW